MKLIDQTLHCVVADRLRIAKNFWERLVGLLGTRSMAPGEGLWLPKCQGIHTFGMAFSIDVIFLDRTGKAVRIAGHVAPNRTGPVEMTADGVIELPEGTLDRFLIQEGDLLEISD